MDSLRQLKLAIRDGLGGFKMEGLEGCKLDSLRQLKLAIHDGLGGCKLKGGMDVRWRSGGL